MYLNDIHIYTKTEGNEYVQAVQWVLNQLQKLSLYSILKKCRFYQEEIRLLGYIVFHQGIWIEEKQIKAICDWPELKSVHDILVFLGFANIYQQFIQGFSRFAAPLTSILKIALVASLIVGDEHDGKGIQVENWDKKEPIQKSRKSQRTAKSKKSIRAKKAEASRAKNLGQSNTFLTADARKTFTKLSQAFIKVPILNHFISKHHIRIEMDASGYAIGGILSQLTLDDLGQWYLVAFFSRKMILHPQW